MAFTYSCLVMADNKVKQNNLGYEDGSKYNHASTSHDNIAEE